MHLAGLKYDRLVEGHLPGLFVLTEEDAQQHGVLWNLHDHIHFIAPKPLGFDLHDCSSA